MKFITADLIYFVDAPASSNKVIVLTKDNTIADILPIAEVDPLLVQKYDGAICPGFVNSHCHLELSHLKNKLTSNKGMVHFITELMAQRHWCSMEERQQYISNADTQMYMNGVVAVGDISNEEVSIATKKNSKLYYHTFVEAVGANETKAQQAIDASLLVKNKFITSGLTAQVTPHAPYSVSATLFNLIQQRNENCTTIHWYESVDEMKLFEKNEGAFISFFEKLNISFTYKNLLQRPIHAILQYLPKAKNLQLVHNTYLSQLEIEQHLHYNPTTYLCACPSANLFIENTLPNYMHWSRATANITLGTDSLASNTALNILNEINIILHHYPLLTFNNVLLWATINGANLLHIQDWAGSIAVGKKPGLVHLVGNCAMQQYTSAMRIN